MHFPDMPLPVSTGSTLEDRHAGSPHRNVWQELKRLDIGTFVRAARMQWSWSHTSSVLVGAAVAFKDGYSSPALLFLTWLGVEFIHAGTCLTNDYWDFVSGADDVTEHTIFNAGSRVIQEGRMSPALVNLLALVCFAIGAAIGVGLAIARGWPVLVLGLIGGLFSYFYTAPPFKLCYRGLDQLAVAVCYGPMSILGSYYVQSLRFSKEAACIAIIYAITASMILYVKGFQDTESDRRAGKESIIIKLGRERAAALFGIFFAAAYALAGAAILTHILPVWMAIIFVSIPLVFSANSALREHLSTGTVSTFFRVLVRTKSVHLFLGMLLMAGYIASRLLDRK